MSPSSEASLPRFSRGERWAHRVLGILVGALLITGAFLFFPDLGSLVGNRQIVTTVHDVAGWLVPVPLVLALFSRAFRADAGRLNRFSPADWQWLRSRDRRSGRIRVGKFNAGQKLNASLTLGALIVLFGTGMVMFWSSLFSDSIRTGATFVHDWVSLALGLLVLGHIWMSFNDATARAGMRTGSVPLTWAEREHPAWAQEMLDTADQRPASAATPSSSRSTSSAVE
ncbi:MAG TPA: formate dehydrogenase [Actinobacteria bacterium]|nr:formate dehydrogenase [Actinomycetota bacterium]